MRIRFALMAAGMLAFLAAIWGGLLRLGWPWPALRAGWVGDHAPLLLAAFLGTLIGVERAAALSLGASPRRAVLYYVAPALTALGGVVLLLGGKGLAGWLFILGGVALVALHGLMVRRERALHTSLMAAGALAFLGAALLWADGRPGPQIVPAWMAFLVLIIAGERLELGRLLRLSRARKAAFLLGSAFVMVGAALAPLGLALGYRLAGLGMLALASWLLAFDLARRTVRASGLTRFIAISLLSGHLWLGVSGVLAMVYAGQVAGLAYDALVHSLFLGFVFSMIFGHAPIIFPALSGRAAAYRPAFYAHLALLHASLLLRIGADTAGWVPGRMYGGLLNAAALLLFLANSLWMMRAGEGG
jgi:hypothetical protein